MYRWMYLHGKPAVLYILLLVVENKKKNRLKLLSAGVLAMRSILLFFCEDQDST